LKFLPEFQPDVALSVLCCAEEEDTFKRLVFLHTSTLGIKTVPINMTILDISFEQLETSLGRVTMKNSILDGRSSAPNRSLKVAANLPSGTIYP
jgi:uncharacterized protein (DUF111 family)